MKKLGLNKDCRNALREVERGRSMVEMLGVLAIIGVLSVMGIAGYTIAMRKYRANEIAQTAAILHVLAMAKEECLTLSSVGMSTNIAGVSVEMMSDHSIENQEVQVCLKSADSKLCDALSDAGGPMLDISCGYDADICSCDEP